MRVQLHSSTQYSCTAETKRSRRRGFELTTAVQLYSNSTVSYTPGLGLCRDRFKGGTRDVEHRNGTCILSRPEEVENERWRSTTVKQWAPPDDTRCEHSPETSPLFHVETPNTVTSMSRHRVREHPQQPPCSLLGERNNKASLIISYHAWFISIPQKLKSMLFFILIIPTQKSESHILQVSVNQFSALNFK